MLALRGLAPALLRPVGQASSLPLLTCATGMHPREPDGRAVPSQSRKSRAPRRRATRVREEVWVWIQAGQALVEFTCSPSGWPGCSRRGVLCPLRVAPLFRSPLMFRRCLLVVGLVAVLLLAG